MKSLVIIVLCTMLIAASPIPEINQKPVCPTPKSLMLHSAYGPERMEQLAKEIEKAGLKTITYSQLYDLWDKGKCAPSNTILVSVDDLSGVWLRHTFVEMIDVFIKHNMVLTLGVVTNSYDAVQNEHLWEYFKDLDKRGFEIASHSSMHYHLGQVEEKYVESDVNDSYYIICKNLGKCPKTLILPYGDGWDSNIVLKHAKEKYRAIVSIAAGNTYGGDLFVMRRIPPYNDDQSVTIQLLNDTFYLVTSGFKLPQRHFGYLQHIGTEILLK